MLGHPGSQSPFRGFAHSWVFEELVERTCSPVRVDGLAPRCFIDGGVEKDMFGTLGCLTPGSCGETSKDRRGELPAQETSRVLTREGVTCNESE